MSKEHIVFTQNRELSWLRFNQRVLEEAQDKKVPLLERMKFIAIFTSNLDEFFMIRVGRLFNMVINENNGINTCTKMDAKQQIDTICDIVSELYKERDEIYYIIIEELKSYGIYELTFRELKSYEQVYVEEYFKRQVLPILTPKIVDAKHLFSYIQNKDLYLIANLNANDEDKIGIVQIPNYISNIMYFSGKCFRYILMEDVINEFMPLIFEGYEIRGTNRLCITRNGNICPSYKPHDLNEDFRMHMQKKIHQRACQEVVRIEAGQLLPNCIVTQLCDDFKLKLKQFFVTKTPMKLQHVFAIMEKIPTQKKKELVYPIFSSRTTKMLNEVGIARTIKKKDVLLSHPYESMEPFLRLIKQAATDAEVFEIKITIYRLAKNSKLVEYLCLAARNGKKVIVLIELRARFDEQNNIDWSICLEEAGCKIFYGFQGYKVHSKICQISYRNNKGISYITHIGTGNYNEKTTMMYSDVSLMTTHQGIGEDAFAFFENMCHGNLRGEYTHLLVSPINLKNAVMHLIDEEIGKGKNGRIIMKMNSVTDTDFILKIAEASRAGVKIDLIVRGICCILPGIKHITENITVTSVVGRYLEHDRIFCFGIGSEKKIYIGSADMMTRNTEKRVEVLCPIYDDDIKKQLIHMLDIWLADNTKSRKMQSNGKYSINAEHKKKICAQEEFMKEILRDEK